MRQEPLFIDLNLPRRRVVIPTPGDFVTVIAHASSPNGEPWLTLRRIEMFQPAGTLAELPRRQQFLLWGCPGQPAIETAPLLDDFRATFASVFLLSYDQTHRLR